MFSLVSMCVCGMLVDRAWTYISHATLLGLLSVQLLACGKLWYQLTSQWYKGCLYFLASYCFQWTVISWKLLGLSQVRRVHFFCVINKRVPISRKLSNLVICLILKYTLLVKQILFTVFWLLTIFSFRSKFGRSVRKPTDITPCWSRETRFVKSLHSYWSICWWFDVTKTTKRSSFSLQKTCDTILPRSENEWPVYVWDMLGWVNSFRF